MLVSGSLFSKFVAYFYHKGFLNSLMWNFLNSRLNSHWLFRGGWLALLHTTHPTHHTPAPPKTLGFEGFSRKYPFSIKPLLTNDDFRAWLASGPLRPLARPSQGLWLAPLKSNGEI